MPRSRPYGQKRSVKSYRGRYQPRAGARGPGDRVDVDRPHPREVEHQATVADPVTGRAVTATTDREQQAVLAREVDRRDDVRAAAAPDDRRRPAVDHAVPDPARRIIAVIGGKDDAAVQASREGVKGL